MEREIDHIIEWENNEYLDDNLFLIIQLLALTLLYECLVENACFSIGPHL